MANYPGAIDSAASLYSPVDAFSGAALETTVSGAVLAGDSTINVASTSGGFAASYGILSIDDELIVYTGKSGTAFTGCQRGAFGTTAAAHDPGRDSSRVTGQSPRCAARMSRSRSPLPLSHAATGTRIVT